jgi:hypothetical protein
LSTDKAKVEEYVAAATTAEGSILEIWEAYHDSALQKTSDQIEAAEEAAKETMAIEVLAETAKGTAEDHLDAASKAGNEAKAIRDVSTPAKGRVDAYL